MLTSDSACTEEDSCSDVHSAIWGTLEICETPLKGLVLQWCNVKCITQHYQNHSYFCVFIAISLVKMSLVLNAFDTNLNLNHLNVSNIRSRVYSCLTLTVFLRSLRSIASHVCVLWWEKQELKVPVLQ